LKYDRGQLIDRLNESANLDSSKLFYYTCQTTSEEKWVESADRFTELLKSKTRMTIEKDVFKTETHTTVFQQGIINAIKSFFYHQFTNPERLVTHLKNMEKLGGGSVTKEELHRIASLYMQYNFADYARKLLISFENNLAGEIEDTNDLFSLFETGKMYNTLGFTDKAKAYFVFCDKKLEQNKNKMSVEFYNFGKEKIKEELKNIESSKQ
jgi:hypothetical protein